MPLAEVAQTGFQQSAAYDANRPTYSAEAVEKLLFVSEVEGVHGAKITDLAAGTGKFTELLAARKENYNITAIEPHDAMRLELERKGLNRVAVIRGTAESMSGIADSSQAAVIVAQAFHWFANMDALKEIHRVLENRGVLGLIWNIEDYNAPKDWTIHGGWESTMRDVMWSLEDGYPRYRNMLWQKVFDDQSGSNPLSLHTTEPLFGLPIGQDSVQFINWLSKEEIWRRFTTYSPVANLKSERREGVEKTFWEAINAPETKVDDQGRVAIHGKTVLAWTSKIPTEPVRSSD